MSILDIIIFFVYIVGITLFGGSFYRKNKTSSAFILGDNNIPGWVIGMSIFATFVSSCIGYILFYLPGGPEQMFAVAFEQNKFSLGSFNLNVFESTFWVVLIYGLFINLQNYGIDQNYIQRYVAARTDTEARRSVLYGGLLYIPVSAFFLFIGTALFSFYTSSAGQLPPELMEANRSDRIFPYFIVNELPAGITGLLIASIFAAGMSTISTSLIVQLLCF